MAGNTGSPTLDLKEMLVPAGLIKTSITTVTTVVAPILTEPLNDRARVYVTNMSSVQVYIGNGSVTVTNGFPLQSNMPLPLPIGEGMTVYAISEGGNTSIRVLELS